MFTFDCDTLGPATMKRAAVAKYAIGAWDDQRPDPRKRDGANAPIGLPDQMGFWAEGSQPSMTDETLTLGDNELPDALAAKLDQAALLGLGHMQRMNRDLVAANLSLSRENEQLRSAGKVAEEKLASAAASHVGYVKQVEKTATDQAKRLNDEIQKLHDTIEGYVATRGELVAEHSKHIAEMQTQIDQLTTTQVVDGGT